MAGSNTIYINIVDIESFLQDSIPLLRENGPVYYLSYFLHPRYYLHYTSSPISSLVFISVLFDRGGGTDVARHG